jgi:hypothetical protein
MRLSNEEKTARKSRKTVRSKKRNPRTAARIAKSVGWLANAERGQGRSAAREAHLRALMGLPAKPTWRDIERERSE